MSEWKIKSTMETISRFLPITQIKLDDRTIVALKDDAITKIINEKQDYEPHFKNIVNSFVSRDDNVIDCGANCGFHTITLSKLVGNNGKVFSFEPLRIIYQQLNCNIFINGLSNVYSYNYAIGDEDKILSMTTPDYYQEGNIGNTWVNLDNTGDSVKMIKLDNFITDNIRFIKLDIQGCELFALKGMVNLIKNNQPTLFLEMEDYHLNRYNTNTQQLSDYIKTELNYDVYRIMTDYPFDFLCVPKNINVKEKNISFELQKI